MAQLKDFKNPPALEADMQYEDWKSEIGMWRNVTTLSVNKQAFAIALSLTGPARAKARSISEADMKKDNGVDILLKELDTLFLRDSTDLAYEAFRNFFSFTKPMHMNMSEYVMEYERLYQKCVKYEMVLPDSVLAFKLLDGCLLDEKDKKLALTAATDRKYDTMKGALRRIFGYAEIGKQSSDIVIKQEPIFFTKQASRFPQKKYPGKQFGLNSGGSFVKQGTNPIDKYGKRSRCMLCQSTYHWMKDCPHKHEHNQVLTSILQKIKAEQNCSWDTALAWALMAKNSLSNIHGYSAHQLVYGRNPNLPSTLVDSPPAVEGTTASVIVGEHIGSLHAARRAYTAAETSEKIRRAIRKQTRPVPDVYNNGDKVYYKRTDSPEWRGPGTVIGRDGQLVFVRHANTLVRVHVHRLRKTTHPEKEMLGNGRTDKNKTQSLQEGKKSDIFELPVLGDEENEDMQIQEENGSSDQPDTQVLDSETRAGRQEVFHPAENERQQDVDKIPSGSIVQYKHRDTDENIVAQVIGRAGKATGKNKTWYNVEYKEPEEFIGVKASVDLSAVKDLQLCQISEKKMVTSAEENVLVLEDVSWNDAKEKELASWRQNDVYEEISDEGQECISVRWICTLKDGKNGMTRKARLVARGFEETEKGDIKCDSPTCAHESLRFILAVLAIHQWKPRCMDIKTAFLQGTPIDRDVYIRPPTEAKSAGKIWHLKKCVYGLCDASLKWYRKVKSVLTELGGHMSQVDPSVFYWTKTNSLSGVLACHVDDFLWGGVGDFEGQVVDNVRKMMTVGKEEEIPFKYVGLQLETKLDGTIFLHQESYVLDISHLDVNKQRTQERKSPLNVDEKHLLRSKIGKVMWAARQTRPDILFSVCNLSSAVNEATVETMLELNKCIKQLKSDKVVLKYPVLSKENLELLVYSDSSLGNLKDGGTQGAHIVFLRDTSTNKVSPIAWTSRRIRRVVRSTIAAETMAMSEALDTGIFVASMFQELMNVVLNITCVTDCKSLIDALQSTKCVAEKRLRMEIASIKEMVADGRLKVKWSSAGKQLADVMTKKGASALNLLRVLESGTVNIE